MVGGSEFQRFKEMPPIRERLPSPTETGRQGPQIIQGVSFRKHLQQEARRNELYRLPLDQHIKKLWTDPYRQQQAGGLKHQENRPIEEKHLQHHLASRAAEGSSSRALQRQLSIPAEDLNALRMKYREHQNLVSEDEKLNPRPHISPRTVAEIGKIDRKTSEPLGIEMPYSARKAVFASSSSQALPKLQPILRKASVPVFQRNELRDHYHEIHKGVSPPAQIDPIVVKAMKGLDRKASGGLKLRIPGKSTSQTDSPWGFSDETTSSGYREPHVTTQAVRSSEAPGNSFKDESQSYEPSKGAPSHLQRRSDAFEARSTEGDAARHDTKANDNSSKSEADTQDGNEYEASSKGSDRINESNSNRSSGKTDQNGSDQSIKEVKSHPARTDSPVDGSIGQSAPKSANERSSSPTNGNDQVARGSKSHPLELPGHMLDLTSSRSSSILTSDTLDKLSQEHKNGHPLLPVSLPSHPSSKDSARSTRSDAAAGHTIDGSKTTSHRSRGSSDSTPLRTITPLSSPRTATFHGRCVNMRRCFQLPWRPSNVRWLFRPRETAAQRAFADAPRRKPGETPPWDFKHPEHGRREVEVWHLNRRLSNQYVLAHEHEILERYMSKDAKEAARAVEEAERKVREPEPGMSHKMASVRLARMEPVLAPWVEGSEAGSQRERDSMRNG